MKKIVAMVALPGEIRRGGNRRAGLPYLKYARAAWEAWCGKRGIEFVLAESVDPAMPPDLPPTFRRWAIPEQLMQTAAEPARVALVDADTMVRWDSPDFFDLSGDAFAAVRSFNLRWIERSLARFQPLFPDLRVRPEQYVNAGVVVVGARAAPILRQFSDYAAEHFTALQEIIASADVGSDQTPLNFWLQRSGLEIVLLPSTFNVLHCFGYTREGYAEFERYPSPDWGSFEAKVLSHPAAFRFVRAGYIWHFTNVVRARERVMAETWRRVSHLY